MPGHVLALDQGTTSTRALIFDRDGGIVASQQQEITQHYPAPGLVEHACEEIWASVLATARAAIAKAGIAAGDIAGIGIANQRETVVIWDRASGEPVHRAIVWQDRRTAGMCAAMTAAGLEPLFAERTGLRLDPYFSGTKLAWCLNTIDGLRARARDGELCFGTIDSWLIWKLTGGRVHASDATNASRTLLYNIVENRWDPDLLHALEVPAAMLPEVRDCAGDFGTTDPSLLGAGIPIAGVAGDQQAATIGNACFKPGMMKATFGTGCFALLNTGPDRVVSRNRMLTTIAYRLDGRTTYALEGSIFAAGATVQWLRDGLGIIDQAGDADALAGAADPAQAVFLVPAFTGLGAPYWDADARGSLHGLTRNTGPREIALAALESVAFQTCDLLAAMHRDWAGAEHDTVLRVDGGMAASNWTMQRLADLLDAPIERAKVLETTALGAAWLAATATGLWPDRDDFANSWVADRRFEPRMEAGMRQSRISGWHDAVGRTLTQRP